MATAFQAVDEADKAFRIDALALKAAAAVTSAKALRTPEDRQRFAAAADGLAAQALAADRYDVARQVADLALSAARSGNDPAALRQAVARVQQQKEAEAAFAAVKKAVAALDKDPRDGAANAEVGRFRCFVKGDWDAGLPLLALGSDAALQTLAESELKGAAAADDQVMLGDGWWGVAERLSGPPAT